MVETINDVKEVRDIMIELIDLGKKMDSILGVFNAPEVKSTLTQPMYEEKISRFPKLLSGLTLEWETLGSAISSMRTGVCTMLADLDSQSNRKIDAIVEKIGDQIDFELFPERLVRQLEYLATLQIDPIAATDDPYITIKDYMVMLRELSEKRNEIKDAMDEVSVCLHRILHTRTITYTFE